MQSGFGVEILSLETQILINLIHSQVLNRPAANDMPPAKQSHPHLSSFLEACRPDRRGI